MKGEVNNEKLSLRILLLLRYSGSLFYFARLIFSYKVYTGPPFWWTIFFKEKVMKKFLSVLLIMVLVFSFMGCSNSGEKETGSDIFKIGVMQFGEFTALINAYDGFLAGLKEGGLTEGVDFEIKYLSAAADTANCPTIADTLINDGSDLIFAIATPSVSCAKEKTNSIPILFTAVTDPVDSGIVSSNEVPGGNITGTSDMNPVAEQIDLVKELLPNAKTVAVMYCSSESNSEVQYRLAKDELDKLGLDCVVKTISAIDEAKSAIESLKGKVDAIYIPTDNTLADGMALVSKTANECGIPIVASEPGQVEGGATITYGIDYFELGKKTAEMAIEILKSDNPLEKTKNMPVQFQTEECVTAINQESVDTLKLDVPKSIMDRAVIY